MFTRRHFIATAAAGGLAAPAIAQNATPVAAAAPADPLAPTQVTIPEGFGPGEIHVDPNIFRLYYTLGGNQAIRYAVGVGRVGLYESGVFRVGAKREWPSWTPTPDMIAREPENYARFADGVPGGPSNPLGARAIYLYDGNRDTYLRIHGTNLPRTIGTAVSNGCARLTNEYVVDLYDRTQIDAPVYLYNRIPA